MRFFKQFKRYKSPMDLIRDLLSGIIVALVSIPISMGYATIAGLPPVYGLYGSLLPILIFAFFTTSPQFVVGVDAMPAVMVGMLMVQMGFAAESPEAMSLAAIMAIIVSLWFLLFYFFKAGRIVKYISTPVMGGFISGIGMTIILMQIPKLFGGAPGTGEVVELVINIWNQIPEFNLLSFALGASTVAIILVCKKFIPKVPMTIVMLAVGVFLQFKFGLDKYGVKLLPETSSGLPSFFIPDFTVVKGNLNSVVITSLGIAAVIMAQTLLASENYAMKHFYSIDRNKELLAYSAMNLVAGVTGVCPINGSVSRSGIADSNGTKTQLMSLTASGVMLAVLLFGTPYLKYMPVPVLTGIVMTALIGIIDTKMEIRLWNSNRNEFFIFIISFLAVLFLGTVNGVLVGVVLSFGEVAVRAVNPPATFVGRIPGHGNYHSLNRNSNARAIKGAVIYRFNGNLFFANIDKLVTNIEHAVSLDTKCVIIDARGIGTIDITAADKLLMLYRSLEQKGIKFYLTEHDGSLNDQLRVSGAGDLIENGAVRQTITLALRDSGYEKPYPLEDTDGSLILATSGEEVHDIKKLTEFEWLYGDESEDRIQKMAEIAADELISAPDFEAKEHDILDGHGVHTNWGVLGLYDEEIFLNRLDKRLNYLREKGKLSAEASEEIKAHIIARRKVGEEHRRKMEEELRVLIEKHRK